MESHTMDYYTVVKMKELDLHVAMWVKIENTCRIKEKQGTVCYFYAI